MINDRMDIPCGILIAIVHDNPIHKCDAFAWDQMSESGSVET